MEINSEIIAVIAKVAGIGGVGLTLIMVLIKNVIQENILKSLPLNQRKSIVTKIITTTFIISLFALLAWVYIEDKKIDSEDKKNENNFKMKEKELAKIDSAEYRKIQNSFSIKGIFLEGTAITTLLDSSKLPIKWEKWINGKPIIFWGATDILDTLKVFYKDFGYSPELGPKDENNYYKETIKKDGEILKIRKLKNAVNIIPSTDPNAELEFAFQTTLQQAINIFGFKRNCFFDEKQKEYNPDSNYQISECKRYLNQAGLRWLLKNYRYKASELYQYGWAPQMNSTKRYLQFYSRICKNKIPGDFINVRTGIEDACNHVESDQIKLSYSTPRLIVKILLIKNEGTQVMTIDHIKLLLSSSDVLRTKKNDLNRIKKDHKIGTKIKILPNQTILIPINIMFCPSNEVKSTDGIIDIENYSEPYLFGSVYYLDTIGINGYKFSI